MSAENDRWAEIRGIHKEYRTFYQVSGGFTIIALLLLFGGIVFANGLLNDYSTNVYTEAVSAVASVIVTVLILDRRAEQREERRRIRDLQARLVREAGSPDNATARNAVRELRAHGWLTGEEGLLKQAFLFRANLKQADFNDANLEGAYLVNANLEWADLNDAKLEGAHLTVAKLERAALVRANLVGAHLEGARLKRAVLMGANLEGAVLVGANLTGADLYKANLKCAILTDAVLAEKIALPDAIWDKDAGEFTPDSYYHSGVTDMNKYTDPDHPDFWQPDWVKKQQTAERPEPTE